VNTRKYLQTIVCKT